LTLCFLFTQRPVFLDDARDGAGANRLALTGSWHPLVPAPAFVRNDVVLGADDAPGCMLLTGPNMGGKSTLLRQVALAVITAHIGCRVPASTCELNVVDSVYCRVGAGDGIQSGVSTFLAEMSDVAAVSILIFVLVWGIRMTSCSVHRCSTARRGRACSSSTSSAAERPRLMGTPSRSQSRAQSPTG
jgi:hypothetical protein